MSVCPCFMLREEFSFGRHKGVADVKLGTDSSAAWCLKFLYGPEFRLPSSENEKHHHSFSGQLRLLDSLPHSFLPPPPPPNRQELMYSAFYRRIGATACSFLCLPYFLENVSLFMYSLQEYETLHDILDPN